MKHFFLHPAISYLQWCLLLIQQHSWKVNVQWWMVEFLHFLKIKSHYIHSMAVEDKEWVLPGKKLVSLESYPGKFWTAGCLFFPFCNKILRGRKMVEDLGMIMISKRSAIFQTKSSLWKQLLSMYTKNTD